MRGNKVMHLGFLFFGIVSIKVIALFIISIFASILGDSTLGTIVQYIISYASQICYVVFYFVSKKYFQVEGTYKFEKVEGKSIAYGSLTAIIGVVCFIGITAVFSYFLEGVGFISSSSEMNVLDYVLSIISAIVFAPICEEIVFRGGILDGSRALFINNRFGKIYSILLSGFLFMIMHMSPSQTVYQFLFGCLLALLVMGTKNIVPAIVAHIVNNVVGIVLLTDAGTIFYAWLANFYACYGVLFTVISIVLVPLGYLLVVLLSKALGKEDLKTYLFRRDLLAEDDGTHKSSIVSGVILILVGEAIAFGVYFVMLFAGIA